MRLVIGARGSRLSVAQAEQVAGLLRARNPGHDFEICTIRTAGDADARPLFTIDQKGIFEREIDCAVAEGRIDLAVHSLKDVPSSLPPGIVLGCVPRRGPPNDVLVAADSSSGLHTLPPGSVVGTSSLRRAVQVSVVRPDLRVKPVRGNIDTRIAKIADLGLDAVILARAGLLRLGMKKGHQILPLSQFLPSPGQGALAVTCRDEPGMISLAGSIEDTDSRLGAEAERALSMTVESGCRFPVGALGEVSGGTLRLRVCAFSTDAARSIYIETSGPKHDAAEIGAEAAAQLKDRGVAELALNWREKVREWNEK